MTEPTPLGLSQQAEPKTQPDAAKGAADTTAADALEAAATKRRRTIRIAIGVALLIVVGLVIWRVFFSTPALPASIVAVSGRIEGDDSAVASKTTGRILEVRVREGDSVNAGDIDRHSSTTRRFAHASAQARSRALRGRRKQG
jgi:multidrug resistance efflux pump